MKKLLSIAAACLAIVAAPVSAATYSNLSGVIVEGPNVDLPSGPFYDNPTVLGDFSNRLDNPELIFSGDAWIFGNVYDCCRDGFKITALDYTFDLVISVVGGVLGAEMDVLVRGGGLDETATLQDGDPAVRLNGLRGMFRVGLDGRHPSNDGNTQWLVDIMNVTPVPVPAAFPMLLAGLGGLGLMARRRRKS